MWNFGYPQEKLRLAVAGYDGASRPAKLALAVVFMGLIPFIGELRRGRRRLSPD
jgi:hypothetical protein